MSRLLYIYCTYAMYLIMFLHVHFWFTNYFFLQVQSTYSEKQLFHFSPTVVIIPTLKVLVIIALFQKYHEKRINFGKKKNPSILIVSWLSPSTTIDVWNFIISMSLVSIWILSQKSGGATLLKEMTVNVYMMIWERCRFAKIIIMEWGGGGPSSWCYNPTTTYCKWITFDCVFHL